MFYIIKFSIFYAKIFFNYLLEIFKLKKNLITKNITYLSKTCLTFMLSLALVSKNSKPEKSKKNKVTVWINILFKLFKTYFSFLLVVLFTLKLESLNNSFLIFRNKFQTCQFKFSNCYSFFFAELAKLSNYKRRIRKF